MFGDVSYLEDEESLFALLEVWEVKVSNQSNKWF